MNKKLKKINKKIKKLEKKKEKIKDKIGDLKIKRYKIKSLIDVDNLIKKKEELKCGK